MTANVQEHEGEYEAKIQIEYNLQTKVYKIKASLTAADSLVKQTLKVMNTQNPLHSGHYIHLKP